jgi:hypothetical protein
MRGIRPGSPSFSCGDVGIRAQCPFACKSRFWAQKETAVEEESSGPAACRSRRLQNVSANRVDFRELGRTGEASRNRSNGRYSNGLRPQLAHRQIVEKPPKNRQFRIRLPPPPPTFAHERKAKVPTVAFGEGGPPPEAGATAGKPSIPRFARSVVGAGAGRWASASGLAQPARLPPPPPYE